MKHNDIRLTTKVKRELRFIKKMKDKSKRR